MKLYSQVERIHAELSAEGYGPDDALPIEVLTRYDQLHYFGTEAVDHAIAAAGIGAGSLVLDIGSGLGGPARHVAATVGAQPTTMLQSDSQMKLVRYAGQSDVLPVTRLMGPQQVKELESLGFAVNCPAWGGACEVAKK